MEQLVERRSRTADKLVGLAERGSRVADKILLELSVAAVGCSAKGPDWFVEVTGTFTA